MIRKQFLIFLLGTTVFAVSCSSDPSTVNNGTANNSQANSSVPAASSAKNAASPAGNFGVVSNSGSNVQSPSGPIEGISDTRSNVNINAPSKGAIAVAEGRKLREGPAPEGTPQPKDLGDGSEMSVRSIKDSFLETRTFKIDRQLDRVERITNSKGASIRIVLRSGKTVNVAPAKIPDLSRISTSDLYTLAGIKVSSSSADSSIRAK